MEKLERIIEDRLLVVLDRTIAEEIAEIMLADKDFRRVLRELVHVRARAVLEELLRGKG